MSNNSLAYLLQQRERELLMANEKINDLLNVNLQLEKEIEELRTHCSVLNRTERLNRHLEERVDVLEKEKLELTWTSRKVDKLSEEEKVQILRKSEDTVQKLRNQIDNMNSKLDSVSYIERSYNAQGKYIRILEEDIDIREKRITEQNENLILEMHSKKDNMKKKMMNQLVRAKKNIEKINLDVKDKNTKLNQLQSYQLLIELDLQSRQIEDLLKSNHELENKIIALEEDLKIHRELEIMMTEKNKKYIEALKKTNNKGDSDTKKTKEITIESVDNIDTKSTDRDNSVHKMNRKTPNEFMSSRNTFFNTHFPTNDKYLKEFNIINNLEIRSKRFQKELELKKFECENLKTNLDVLKEKMSSNEKKFSALYQLFEGEIEKLVKDDSVLKNYQEISINMDEIKKGEFSKMSKENQYALILLIIKYLLPLINPKDIKTGETPQIKFKSAVSKTERTSAKPSFYTATGFMKYKKLKEMPPFKKGVFEKKICLPMTSASILNL